MQQFEDGRAPGSALVVEGGALRGVFSTGVLDGFLERGFNPFDFCIGVSSGASNLAAYLAEMIGRNRTVYLDYSLRPGFIDFSRFLRGGHLLDLDWLWDITIREIRLDLKKIYSRGKRFYVVMTDVRTGKAEYTLPDADGLEQALKAASAAPPLYRNFPEVGGVPMADGGLSDALPVQEAVRLGARKIMVIRSRHRGYVRNHNLSERIMSWAVRRFPALRGEARKRVERYNESVSLIRTPPPGITFVEICPPEGFRVSRLSRDPVLLQEGYEQGRALAETAIVRWKEIRISESKGNRN